MDTKQARMKEIADTIKVCRVCPGMNMRDVTESAPAFGSVDSPVAIVGQSLCRKCMKSGVPFTGGSGRYIDEALEQAGKQKRDIFITNVVHCHPPEDRPSEPHEIANCRHFLHDELAIVKPTLAIGLGKDARIELIRYYPHGEALPWPFTEPRNVKAGTTYLLFPNHPGSLRFKPTADREYWSPSLARAIEWSFSVR